MAENDTGGCNMNLPKDLLTSFAAECADFLDSSEHPLASLALSPGDGAPLVHSPRGTYSTTRNAMIRGSWESAFRSTEQLACVDHNLATNQSFDSSVVEGHRDRSSSMSQEWKPLAALPASELGMKTQQAKQGG